MGNVSAEPCPTCKVHYIIEEGCPCGRNYGSMARLPADSRNEVAYFCNAKDLASWSQTNRFMHKAFRGQETALSFNDFVNLNRSNLSSLGQIYHDRAVSRQQYLKIHKYYEDLWCGELRASHKHFSDKAIVNYLEDFDKLEKLYVRVRERCTQRERYETLSMAFNSSSYLTGNMVKYGRRYLTMQKDVFAYVCQCTCQITCTCACMNTCVCQTFLTYEEMDVNDVETKIRKLKKS